MLKNITQALALSFLVSAPSIAQQITSETIDIHITEKMLEKYGTGFVALEHRNLGDSVLLHLNNSDTYAKEYKFTLPNGIKLTYGDIVMYAGDLFGNPEVPISNCALADRPACFQSQFVAMAISGAANDPSCLNPLNQARMIKKYMEGLEKDLLEAKKNGVESWDFYSKNDSKISEDMNALTCGGSIISRLIPFGLYIKLAQVNFDHFVPDSLIAYKAGHKVALQTAIAGFKKNQEGKNSETAKLLELAYAQNAFANHFLTDSFSSGHMRTPRRAINNDIALPAVLNLIIANLMHDEDNRNGLNVANQEGTRWMAYGDGYLDKPEAQVHKEIIQIAMQRSVDGIYEAFITGAMPTNYPEMNLLPLYSQIEQQNQTSPLFKTEDGVLLKRVTDEDYYDYHWTKYWSGLATLIKFKASQGES